MHPLELMICSSGQGLSGNAIPEASAGDLQPSSKSGAPHSSDVHVGAAFVESLQAFTAAGRQTQTEMTNGVSFCVNAFWTSRQRQGDPIHEVSYRACFKPELAEFFIERLSRPGDTVYDPFSGRGTTAIQSGLMGRNAIANDVNPLAAMLARPRTQPPTMEEVAARLSEIDWQAYSEPVDDLLVFFHPGTFREILALRDYLLDRERSGSLDAVDDWIRMVALNRLTGHSPGFLSVYTMPPNQAVSLEAQRKINERRKQVPPYRNVVDVILAKTKSLLRGGQCAHGVAATFLTGLAQCSGVLTNTVDLVVTSPPFLDIVQYSKDNWLRCWFAGINPAEVSISMHRNPEHWRAFIHDVLADLARVVKPGGHICFEVGEVRKGTVCLEELVLEATRGLPFEVVCVVVNDQRFTKTSNCWGVDNNVSGTNSNRVMVMRRMNPTEVPVAGLL